MEGFMDFLKATSSLTVLIYFFLVTNGLLENNLMTYQWIGLLVLLFFWVMIRVIEVPKGEK